MKPLDFHRDFQYRTPAFQRRWGQERIKADQRYSDTPRGKILQQVMDGVGHTLKERRQVPTQKVSLEDIAYVFEKEPADILLAEEGCVPPLVFFTILPDWAELLGFQYQELIETELNGLLRRNKRA